MSGPPSPVRQLTRDIKNDLIWRAYDDQHITKVKELDNGFDLTLEDGRTLEVRVTLRKKWRRSS